MDAITRWIRREPVQPTPADLCRDERIREADRRMDEQETRLMMHEWEAYGHPRRRSRDQFEQH